ncbi:MAG TPA: P-loop NTPase fold protein [Flavisolibacter sp.]|jgi:hypothetical protein|nr:P-loop NTPase fold protein [Flavisolibacter sp.]
MNTEIRTELFRQIGQNFDHYFSKHGNDKIIFSGRYGSGKTTFLKSYFDAPTEIGLKQHPYELFRISPVNYSVAGNSDIIELIKYDIITEFLLKGIDILTADIPSYLFVSDKDITTIFKSLLSLINVKGIDLSRVLQGLKELKKRLDERKQRLDEGDTFINFLDAVENESGVFERDIVTKTIENVLGRLSGQDKVPVLVIDDFDRLDPDHTFRILNIFSAHFDNELYYKRGLRNKFGFEKVIIVCDYQNIQSLFHNRYGTEADFAGYMDKFYSSAVFDFDIKEEVSNYIRDILLESKDSFVSNNRDTLYNFGMRSEELLQQSIVYAVLTGMLPLRSLLKVKTMNLERQYSSLYQTLFSGSRRTMSYTVFLFLLNVYLAGGLLNFSKLIDCLFEKRLPLQLDKFLQEMIVDVEKRYAPFSKTDIVTIVTSLCTYTFKPNEQNGYDISLIDNNHKDFISFQSEHTLDLIKHLILRVEQMHVRV